MTNPLARNNGQSLTRTSAHRLPARLQRAISNEVALAQGHAVVAATRTQAVEYVTFNALRAVESLTEMEAAALRRNPLGDARYRAIVDTATGALARIVAETGQA